MYIGFAKEKLQLYVVLPGHNDTIMVVASTSSDENMDFVLYIWGVTIIDPFENLKLAVPNENTVA